MCCSKKKVIYRLSKHGTCLRQKYASYSLIHFYLKKIIVCLENKVISNKRLLLSVEPDMMVGPVQLPYVYLYDY